MSYIGSSATPLPVAFSGVRTQSFNGTGSQTAFTLSRAVSAVTDIEVVVNNVQQSPYDSSYNISGATLTFSEAPSSGTNNIYVIFRDQPVGSLVPFDGSVTPAKLDRAYVNKAGDTMTGNLVVNASGSVFEARSADTYARFTASNGSAQLGLFRSGDSAGGFYVGGDATKFRVYNSSFTPVLEADSSGRVTMPYQPSFTAYYGGANVAVSGFLVPETCPSNVGNAYSTSTGRFTAPVAGRYFIQAGFLGWSAYGSGRVGIKKNGSWYPAVNASAYARGDDSFATHGIVVDMVAGDYVQAFCDVGIYSSYFFFTGHLIG